MFMLLDQDAFCLRPKYSKIIVDVQVFDRRLVRHVLKHQRNWPNGHWGKLVFGNEEIFFFW